MALYAAYGLVLSSDLELTGLHRIEDGTDITADVRILRGECEPGPVDGDWYSLEPDRSHLVWDGVCRLSIANGNEIIVTQTGGDTRLVSHFVLGPAMGLLLQQRDLFPMHASAVEIDGLAIAFAGDSGVGKSTLAHALCMRGHRLVTDDIAALDVRGDTTVVWHGHAALRLWPDSLEKQGLDPVGFGRVHGETEKRIFALGDGAHSAGRAPLALGRVYLLRPGERLATEELEGIPKTLALLRHVYHPELTSGARGPSALLKRCVQISPTTQVIGVDRPDGVRGTAELVALIEGCTA